MPIQDSPEEAAPGDVAAAVPAAGAPGAEAAADSTFSGGPDSSGGARWSSEVVEVSLPGARTKTHLAHAVVAAGAPSGRTAMCGWHFGRFSGAQVYTQEFQGLTELQCANCKRSVRSAGLVAEEKGNEGQQNSNDGQDGHGTSSSSGASDSGGS